MSKWEMVKLGDVVSVIGGYAFKSTEFIKNGVPIIRIGNINGETVDIDNSVCYAYDFWKQNAAYRIVYGDILIAMSGATVGKVGRYLHTDPALLNQRVGVLRIHPDKIHSDYLYYYVKSNIFMESIFQLSNGCAQPNISAKQIESILIPLPPIETQKQIARTLDAVVDLLAMRKKQLEELDNLIMSLFYNMFGDPYENTKKWDVKKIGEIAQIFIGITYKPQDISETGTIVLRSSNVQNNSLDFKDIVRVKKEITEKYYVQKDDILMCSRNGSKHLVGKTALIPELNEKMTFGAFMTIIRSKYFVYLNNFFRTNSFKMQLFRSETTTINQITKSMLDNVIVPFPPVTLQNQFAEIVTKIEEQKLLVKHAISETQHLFDSLMSQYFD